MEKEGKRIDSKVKFSWKIKWMLAALLLALWSSNFSYSQENDSVRKVDITKLESYEQFRKNELVRCLTLKERNSIFQMFAKLITSDTRNGFMEFSEINKELKNIFEQMPKDESYIYELDNFLKELDYLYLKEKNIECRLAITYMKSRISDEKMKYIDWSLDSGELLKRQLKIWDIILLNKKNSSFDIWTKALKIFDEKYLTDFTHALIFIWFDESWNILVRHSTTAVEKFHEIGVENTKLDSYIFDKDRSNAEWYDIVVLRPDGSILQSILECSEEKLGSWYDNLSALRQGLWMRSNFNNKYNCVELITQSIDFDNDFEKNDTYFWIKWDLQEQMDNLYYEWLYHQKDNLSWKTFPNDLFEYPCFFKPVYLWSLSK